MLLSRRPRPGRAPARCPERPIVLVLHRRRGGRRPQGRPGAGRGARRASSTDCTEAVGEVGGFSATVRGRRIYLIEAAEKGMAWMRLTARGQAGHGSMINRDNAVTRLAGRGRPDRRPRVAGAADPDDARCCWPRSAELAGTEATPENAEALVEEFGSAARMLGAVIRNTANPTMLERRLQGQRDPRPRRPAQVDGRFLPGYEDEFFATLAELVRRGHRRATTSPTSRPGRRRTTASWSTR